MKSIRSIKAALGLLAVVAALAGANLARATNYTIDINTSSIAPNNPAGPFYLDLQSLWGSGSAQTITVSNFVLTGGTFIGGTDSLIGAVTGGVGSSLVLNPSSGNFYNEFFQQFDSTVTDIKFDLSFIPNASGVTPTSFAVSILDSLTYNIPTNGVGDSLVLFSINGNSTNFQTGSSTGNETGGVTASVTVPDAASTGAMILGAVLVLAGCSRRLRRTASVGCV